MTGIDTAKKEILCKDGRPPLSYDVLSIDIGITPRQQMHSLLSTANITPVKPIDGFARRWEQFLNRIQTSSFDSDKHVLKIVIVGGGAGGCELSFAVQYRINELLRKRKDKEPNNFVPTLQVIVVSRTPSLLPSHNTNMQRLVARMMQEKGIEVLHGEEVLDVTTTDGTTALVTKRGTTIPFDEAIWCTDVCIILPARSCSDESVIGVSAVVVTNHWIVAFRSH